MTTTKPKRAEGDLWEKTDQCTMDAAKALIGAWKGNTKLFTAHTREEYREMAEVAHKNMQEVHQRPGKSALILELGHMIKKLTDEPKSEEAAEGPAKKGASSLNWGKSGRAMGADEATQADLGV